MALRPRSWLAILLMAVFVCDASAAFAENAPSPRLALVVGNAAYRSGNLPTAANDAGLVAQALAQDGFAVTALADADAETLHKAFEAFAGEVKQAGDQALVFVYISGMGVQYGGRNYVVPARAAIEKHADIPDKAVAFAELLRTVEIVPAHARFFVYDLAYATPLATAGPIPLAAGLRHMEPTPGSLYAFNAAPGMVAPQGVPPYGLYARAWAEALRTPGLTLHALFSRLRLRVAEITSGSVLPWDNGEVDPAINFAARTKPVPTGEVANRPLAGLPVETVFWAALTEDTLAGYQAFLNAFPKDPLADRIRAMRAVRLEAANWAEACRSNTPEAYWTFMRRYPRGPHYVDVRRRLEAVHAALEPPMRFEATDLGGLPAPTTEEIRAVDHAPAPADRASIPPPPAGLLPAAPAEFGVDLAPPPLVPRGALPISFPVVPEAANGVTGAIVQPYVSDRGRLTFTASLSSSTGATLTMASDTTMLSRTTATYEGHLRSLLQSEAANKVVSRTTAKRAGDTLTISQTGPDDRVVIKLVTRFSLKGDYDTRVSNGAGQLVAEVAADRRNAIKSIRRGSGVIDDAVFERMSAGSTVEERAPALRSGKPGVPENVGGAGERPPVQSKAHTLPDQKSNESKTGEPAPLPPKSALRIGPAEPDLSGPTPMKARPEAASPQPGAASSRSDPKR